MSLRHWSSFVVLCILWGIPYFFIKLALEDLSPLCVAWSRITLAALVVTPIAWRAGALQAALRRRGAVIAFAFAELVIPFPLVSLAETWISSSLTGVLIAAAPLLTVALSPLFGIKESMSARRAAGLLVGLAGVIALLGLDNSRSGHQWVGVSCVIVATVGYVVGPLVVQKHLHDIAEIGSLAASLWVASLALLPAALLTAPMKLPATTALWSVLTLGWVCTATALLLYFYLISRIGAARASLVAYVCPGVAAALGVAVLNEHFNAGMVAAFALILLGSWLATHRAPASMELASNTQLQR